VTLTATASNDIVVALSESWMCSGNCTHQ